MNKLGREESFFYTFYTNISDAKVMQTLLGYKISLVLCSKTKYNTNVVRFDKELKEELCELFGVKMQTLSNELTNLRKTFVISVDGKECMINPNYLWYGSLTKRKQVIKQKEVQMKFNFILTR